MEIIGFGDSWVAGHGVEIDERYSDVPNDLKVATMDYIKMLYKQTEANQRFGLQGESGGQFDLASSGWPPHVRRILDMYRIPF